MPRDGRFLRRACSTMPRRAPQRRSNRHRETCRQLRWPSRSQWRAAGPRLVSRSTSAGSVSVRWRNQRLSGGSEWRCSRRPRRSRRHAVARLEALRALAADGDGAAAAELSAAATAGGGAERRLLASIGNERAVNDLITDLKKGTGNATSIIETLGQSGSKAAIPPLSTACSNPSPEIRGAAVESLGKLGNTLAAYDLVPRIKPLACRPDFVRPGQGRRGALRPQRYVAASRFFRTSCRPSRPRAA